MIKRVETTLLFFSHYINCLWEFWYSSNSYLDLYLLREDCNQKMPRGTLEVILIGAKGLHDTDFFSKYFKYNV